MPTRILKSTAVLLVLAGLASTQHSAAFAQTIYVNNRVGNDRSDGASPERIDPKTGPVATICRALELVGTGGTISLAKTDIPYHEAVRIDGVCHRGFEHYPLTIEGNGAIVDGSIAVAPEGWRRVGENTWKLTPQKKGHFLLLLDGKVLPEHSLSTSMQALPEIPVGHWTTWRGSIYFQAKPRDYVPQLAFRIAYEDVGLTLYQVNNVAVRNLTFQHFRLDGVSAPDRAKSVLLDNVTCAANARAGLAVGGTSDLVVHKCTLTDNRRESLLISGNGRANVEDSNLSQPPTIVK